MRGSRKSERATGDLITYFILHNIISITFFFLITIQLEIYVGKDRLIGYIFQKEFWDLAILQVFPISIVSSIIGRITAFFMINLYLKYQKKKAPKRWSELNKGLNKLGLQFIITAIITAIFYSLGIIGILQYAVFSEETLLSLIIIYVGVKIGTFYFVQWFIGTKL